MISASHNPFDDNGIKLFGPDGYKLSDEDERCDRGGCSSEEPKLAEAEHDRPRPADRRCARALHPFRQVDACPSNCASTGSRSWSIAPMARPTRSRPTRCGSWAPKSSRSASRPTAPTSTTGAARPRRRRCRKRWSRSGADIGLALDGDADRLIVVDEKGKVVDGDQLMALIAIGHERARHCSRAAAVVATVMSNLGLERRLAKDGLALRPHRGRRPLRARGNARRRAATSAASSRATSS